MFVLPSVNSFHPSTLEQLTSDIVCLTAQGVCILLLLLLFVHPSSHGTVSIYVYLFLSCEWILNSTSWNPQIFAYLQLWLSLLEWDVNLCPVLQCFSSILYPLLYEVPFSFSCFEVVRNVIYTWIARTGRGRRCLMLSKIIDLINLIKSLNNRTYKDIFCM